jgi:DNA invertase Pin-like site-specific DNA recombinase
VRAAIYARVSTSNTSQAPTMQTRELRELCQHRGWEIAGEYVDRGVSGAKDSRPELNRMMVDVQPRRFDAVQLVSNADTGFFPKSFPRKDVGCR